MADRADIVAANSGVGAMRTLFDVGALEGWLGAHLDGFAGPVTVEQFKGGQSNPTYRLTTPGARYVLRRKPAGPVLKGAHDVLREARVQQALAGSDVPVARIHAVCEDDSIIGSAFYIMDMVEGRVFWGASLADLPMAQRAACYDETNRVIAALHAVDYRAVGLGDYGRPGNYFARQIKRWSGQYLADERAGRDPVMDELVAWLPGAIPDGDETSIVHGDFRIDNAIFHPTEPRILAVLDWELSTLGHPLADFAYHAMVYSMPPDIVAGLGGADPVALGLPPLEDYIAAYCRRTGRSGIENWNFYLAFNYFRLAAIFHGIKGRVLRGNASNAQAAQRAQAFPRLARLAHSFI
ncbi:phosphotransferase family protein [Novosphingobium sp. SG707]|uniref:phosphotransferase family protein n=1 Tax=Novosphingobium sp. SG707 TaxID=2586996 RepID=UPI001446C727|nr:phosphotransferase family protein [Novosphingobium sp. SG707]NKJ02741.1 aminoglycoside phosphotransferase (APT) family kinase protein [Novosphingobium sp. SG707]